MLNLIYVILGGAFGATLRYLIKLLWRADTFPFATLTVNLLGCFLIGLFGTFMKDYGKTFAIVGLLGAFTTFSSFASETVDLFLKGNYSMVFLNFLLNNVLGILMVYAGLRMGAVFIK